MEKNNNIETYFDGGNHQGEIVDGLVTYSSNDCSFRLKDESWQAYESKILKPTDLTILTNETPFTNSQLAKALVEMWFAEENEDRKEIANRKARDRRAAKREIAEQNKRRWCNENSTRRNPKDQMIARYRKELKDDLQETYEGHCVLQDHGTFTGTFKGFLNNPLGCNSCLQQGLITWDRDINESLVWDAMRKMITEKKAAEQQAAEEEVTS
jgi:hypothetical protein